MAYRPVSDGTSGSCPANPDAVRADGLRPIHCALRRHPDLAAVLLKRGASYNIYLAAVMGDSAYVRDALARDAALSNFEDSSHHRPISAAAARNDLEMVRLLLDHGANPSLPEHGAPLARISPDYERRVLPAAELRKLPISDQSILDALAETRE